MTVIHKLCILICTDYLAKNSELKKMKKDRTVSMHKWFLLLVDMIGLDLALENALYFLIFSKHTEKVTVFCSMSLKNQHDQLCVYCIFRAFHG